MIRRFIQCKNTKERLAMLESTQIQDWTEGEVGLLSSHNAIANSERNSEKRLIPVLQGKANSDSTLELFL